VVGAGSKVVRAEPVVRLAAVSAKQVGLIPKCAECEAVWLPPDEERWRAYLTDDEPPQLAFYCLECGVREFES